jgi:hypothetical protein
MLIREVMCDLVQGAGRPCLPVRRKQKLKATDKEEDVLISAYIHAHAIKNHW